MARLKGELQADNGDVLYPHTSSDVVFTSAGKTVTKELEEVKKSIESVDVSWDGITGKPPTFPPSPHTDHSEINTGLIKGKALTTNNKQLINHTSDAVYVGNPTVALSLESKDEIRANIGGKVKTVLHNESVINADTVDGKHASDFPLKSQGIGGNAPVWSGSNLDSLPIGTYTTVASGVPEAGIYHIVTCQLNNIGDCGWQMAVSQNPTSKKVYMRVKAGNVWSDWKSLGEGGGDVAGKTYVKATRTVENTGNPNSNLEVINYSNSKGGVCKIAQFGSAKMQIIVDGVMVLDGTGTNSYYSNHEFLMGDALSESYGELPTYPFKNNVKVVDRSSNAGTRVYTAHFYVNS